MPAARLLLAVLTVLALATPVFAVQELPVNLLPDVRAQLVAERKLKGLIDEWALTAFDVTFTARPGLALTAPDQVKVALDGFTIAFAPAWYARYKAFYDETVKQPWGAESIGRGLAYARTGPLRLVATLIDAKGQPLVATHVWHTRAPARWAPVEQHLFGLEGERPLAPAPPDLRQAWSPPPGEDPYVVVTPAAAKAARRIRIGAVPGGKWPVELTDPLVATPKTKPVPASARPSASGSGPGGPSAAPSGLSAPTLPSPRVAPPRRELRGN